MAILLKMDERGYANMDQLLEVINGLPKVQRAIIHQNLNEAVLAHSVNEHRAGSAFVEQQNNLLANWLYA